MQLLGHHFQNDRRFLCGGLLCHLAYETGMTPSSP
jgi:hypothetical protein